jgi:dihydropyrimidine dehydrogenase (NAD+) subunit PreA
MGVLEVEIAGIALRNPLILASATPSWDGERSYQAWKHGAGAVIPKSFGPPGMWADHPRCGRMKIVRSGRKPIGMVNVELYTTMAIQKWLDSELDTASREGNVIIASVVAHPNPDDTAANSIVIADTGKIAMFEINVSCPMPAGADKVGFQMGNDPEMCYQQVKAVKERVSVPVGIKLTPTTHNMVPMARASEEAGADFITIGNSVRSFAGVDIRTGRPKIAAFGGYSGAAIKPITQRHVTEVARAVNTPIIAVGGISSWEDVVEYVMLGATAVQICTVIMWNGYEYFQKLLDGLMKYMEQEKLHSLEEIRGKALPYIVTIEELAMEPPMAINVREDACTNLLKGGCEMCGKVCFYDAIEFSPKLTLKPDACDGCGLCTEICPTGALYLETIL